jgi:predicted  nucleic acid-binding Zn-ribbon protein
MSKFDINEANAALKSRERRTGQNLAPVPKEIKELSKTKARLGVEAGHLRRQLAKHGKAVKPAAASAAKPSQGPAKKKHTLEEAANLVPGWKSLGPQERLAKLRELNRQ